jgi:hypothetical protein
MRHQRETLPVHRSTTKHEQFRHPTKLMSVQNTLNWIFTWNNSVVKLSLRYLKAWIIVKSVYFFCFIKKNYIEILVTLSISIFNYRDILWLNRFN